MQVMAQGVREGARLNTATRKGSVLQRVGSGPQNRLMPARATVN